MSHPGRSLFSSLFLSHSFTLLAALPSFPPLFFLFFAFACPFELLQFLQLHPNPFLLKVPSPLSFFFFFMLLSPSLVFKNSFLFMCFLHFDITQKAYHLLPWPVFSTTRWDCTRYAYVLEEEQQHPGLEKDSAFTPLSHTPFHPSRKYDAQVGSLSFRSTRSRPIPSHLTVSYLPPRSLLFAIC